MNKKIKNIIVFVLSTIILLSAILPITVLGDSIDDNFSIYIVKSGDTLSKIASMYGVTVANIVEANNILAADKLYAGQKLNIPGAKSIEDDTITKYSASNTISFDFKDADLIGSLNTVLAHTGYSMVFKGETTTVTCAMDNISPLSAIDMILRMVDMTYIKNDGIIYVGSAEVLNASFADKKALTHYQLRYINTNELKNQLSTLGVNIEIVEVDINNRNFWISGYPVDLIKVNDLIKLLDTPDNIQIGSAKIGSYFKSIDMKYISASEFSSLLGQLGLHEGITTESHPMKLYVYATGDAYDDIMKIKAIVDTKDAKVSSTTEGKEKQDVTVTDGTTSLTQINLKYLTKDNVKEIVTVFGYNVEVLGLEMYEKRVWLRGESQKVKEAVDTIKKNDTEENNRNIIFFTYELKNVVASEIQKKLSYTDTEGIKFYFGSYPNLTKSIVVYCPANKESYIKDLLSSLDNNLGQMYYPVATLTGEKALDKLQEKEELVVKMLNSSSITIDSFKVSENIGSEEPKYILYVLESPENIDLIIDMWGKIA